MANFYRTRVDVDPDLFDLVPVFMDSLKSELEEMAHGVEDGNYELVREKIHSSKGAALTFGFTMYAEELDVLRQQTLKLEEDMLRKSLLRLKSLLDNSVFVPAG